MAPSTTTAVITLKAPPVASTLLSPLMSLEIDSKDTKYVSMNVWANLSSRWPRTFSWRQNRLIVEVPSMIIIIEFNNMEHKVA